MSRNHSLDEFAGIEDGGRVEADEGVDDAGGPIEVMPAAETDPLLPTFTAAPDGARCDACDGTATERWRADDGLVCSACKSW